MIELAKSGRSKCQICGELIEKETLRLGIETPDENYPKRMIVQWFHLKCAARRKSAELLAAMNNFNGEIPDKKEIEKLMNLQTAETNIKIEDFNSLMDACKNGDLETVKQLLKKGVNINACNYTDRTAYLQDVGQTALMKACEHGQLEIVELLLENGADVNAKSQIRTALIYASLYGHTNVVKLLIERGADVNDQVKSYETALIGACRLGYSEIASLMIEKGANVNMNSQLNRTALIWATINGHAVTVEILIKKGADINAEDFDEDDRHNALYFAFKGRHPSIIKLLIDANIAKDKGKTILPQVIHYSYKKDIITHLIKAGADVNTEVLQGMTLLSWASKNRYADLVDLLKQFGAKDEDPIKDNRRKNDQKA